MRSVPRPHRRQNTLHRLDGTNGEKTFIRPVLATGSTGHLLVHEEGGYSLRVPPRMGALGWPDHLLPARSAADMVRDAD